MDAAAVGRPISGVLRDILQDVQELVRAELRLAKAELRQDGRQAASSAAWLAAAATCGLCAFNLLLWAAAFALSAAMPLWAAVLAVAAASGVAAGVLLAAGRRRLRQLRPGPERTVASIKENVQWIKQSTR